jgi:hypothetical protein
MPASTLIVNGTLGKPSSRQLLASGGEYFVCTNPTPGTAIAFANKTAFSATANGLFSISNGNPTGGANIQLDRLKLIQTATAPANGLVTRCEVYTESGVVALTTAALAVTPVNVNPGSANATGATVTFFSVGAGTVAAAVGTRRLVAVGSLASGVNVQYDSWTFEFGADGFSGGTAAVTAARATGPADLVCHLPPITIAPGYSAWMNLWGKTPDTNVPSYEFCLTYVEL